MKYKTEENLFMALGCFLVFSVIAFQVYIAMFADCEKIGWLPITNTPARCVTK